MSNEQEETTQQVSGVTPPELRNPTGKGGFGDNPQNRNPGGWKPENTISYQYNRYMAMSPEAFEEAANEENRTMAMVVAYNRVKEAKNSLNDVKEITDRTEGRARQSVDVTSGGQKIEPMQIIDLGNLDAVKHETE